MAALKMLFSDDDEPFGYPRTHDQPPDDFETEPPITLEPEIRPQVFE